MTRSKKFKSKPVIAEPLTLPELEQLKEAFVETAELAYAQVDSHKETYEPLDWENQIYISNMLQEEALHLAETPKKVGVIFGKFYPLHQGHLYMIDRARLECDHLYIFVCSDEKRDERLFWDSALTVQPTREVRTAWVKRATASYENVEVFNLREDNIPSYPNGWLEWAKVVSYYLDHLPYKPKFVYTSEPQDAENYKTYLDLTAVLIDPNRDFVPISGTECRRKVFTNFNYLPEVVKADVVLNINLDLDELLRFYGIDPTQSSSELRRIAYSLRHMCRNYGYNFCTSLLDDFANNKVRYSFANNGPVTITWGNPGPIAGSKEGRHVHSLYKTAHKLSNAVVTSGSSYIDEDEVLELGREGKARRKNSPEANALQVAATAVTELATSYEDEVTLGELLANMDPEFASNVAISKEIANWFNNSIGLPERNLTANAFNHYTVRVFSTQDPTMYCAVTPEVAEKNKAYAKKHKLPYNAELGVYYPSYTDFSLIRESVNAQNNEFYMACALHNRFRYEEGLVPEYLGVTNYAHMWHPELNFLPTGLNYKLSAGVSYKVGIANLSDLEFAIVTVVRTLISRLQESMQHPYNPEFAIRPPEVRLRRLKYLDSKLDKILTQEDLEFRHDSKRLSTIRDKLLIEEPAPDCHYGNLDTARKEELLAALEELIAYYKERECTAVQFYYQRTNPTDPVEPKTYLFMLWQESDTRRSNLAIKYLITTYSNWVDLYSFKRPGFGFVTPDVESRTSVEQQLREHRLGMTRKFEPRVAQTYDLY